MTFVMRRPCKEVIEHQAGGYRDTPRMESGAKWKQEADRRHQMRRGDAAQPFTFAQSAIDQPQLPLWQIAEAAMNQLGGMRRGGAGEIAAIDQRNAEAAQCGIPR